MRYYVYVSDAKLDMLAGQVPPKLRQKLATELKIDIKIFSLSLKENPTETNRYDKLSLVRRTLAADGAIGTIAGDSEWFEGTLPMHWGPYLHHERLPGHEERGREYDAAAPMVFFAGETTEAQVGLGGSRRHLIGEQSSLSEKAMQMDPDAPLVTSYSDGYSILAAIRRATADEQADPHVGNAVAMTVNRVLGGARILHLPPSKVEFLALRLVDVVVPRPSGQQRVILGTPLYVARAAT